MAQVIERHIDVGGLTIRAVEAGEGPLVLMIHGFPGLAYSWRHQMVPLAEAGFRAVAIDSPGYGGSDRPLEQEPYTAAKMQEYLLRILDFYGAEQAFLLGQDFGAQYAWNMAARTPERVRGLVATIPYDYDLAGRALLGSKSILKPSDPTPPEAAYPDRLPSERFAAMATDHFVHFHYFQSVGPAENELGHSIAEYLRRSFWSLSAEGNLWAWEAVPSEGSGYLDALPPAPPLPWRWMNEAEFQTFVDGYDHPDVARRFIGGLNSYRTADANWLGGLPWADTDVTVPTLFVYGDKDPSFGFFADWEERMRRRVPGLTDIIALEGAGHMVQQEAPAEFNAAILPFLKDLA